MKKNSHNTHAHIIALACSPSKGRNSDAMLDAFIEGVKEVDNVTVEKIYLNDMHIDHFTFENSKGPLEHEKEFAELTQKITEHIGLVIATPTYNFSVPAQLKNFIDRIRFISLDLTKKNKLGQPVGLLGHLRLYYLVSGGTPTWAEKLLFFAFPAFWLRSVFLYFGAHCMGAYYSGDVQTFRNAKKLAKCRKLGKKYAKNLLKGACNDLPERIFWRPPQVD